MPLLTGFPPSTTLFFTAIGTLLFLLITKGMMPSYLGSSFGLLVGIVVHFAGVRWIEVTMPPVVTGCIVALIGLNLAPAAWDWVKDAPLTAVITIVTILVTSVLFRGMLGRLSILIGVLVGYGAAWLQGQIDFSTVGAAAWTDSLVLRSTMRI